MFTNRSMPASSVIPVLAYTDVDEAAAWLCNAFGFSVRLRIGKHRVQLHAVDGAVILREARPNESDMSSGHSIMVRIEDADSHCEQARKCGAHVKGEPTTFPYGERQYTAVDPAGHVWTFSQSVADTDPVAWGGTPDVL